MDALYQKQILELAKQSRTRELDINAPLQASCDNTTCGDRVDISFALKDGAINNIGIKVRGCALCEAGAGLVLAKFEGMKQDTARQMTAQFTRWIGKEQDQVPNDDMAKFLPVRDIRNRHKCVLLAFQAAMKALGQS
ncbi:iron-sulfur cluster assembly scaffold protein [Alphaproteobacteria bacterium]|nr:iron-sulfur cluster assembly scaffold protein [Alphaproteobacteria bacterium]